MPKATGRKVFVRGVSLDRDTDAWVASLQKGGGNFSAWVRGKIMEEIQEEA
jgi:hypothetical protein